MITRSPEQYNDANITLQKNRDISEYGGSIVVFDDMLEYN